MSANLIVGFSAAGTAAGLVPGAQPQPPAPAGGLQGGFGRLLGALLGTGSEPAGDAIAAGAAALGLQAAAPQGKVSALPVIAGAELPLFEVPAVPEAVAAPSDELPAATAPLLLDLVQALSALDTALQSGEPVDPLLREQLDEALAALSAYLELPPPPAQDAARPAAAHLLAAATVVPPPAAGAPPAAGQPPDLPPSAAASPSAPQAAVNAAARPAVAPSPLLARLAEKLQSMGTALEPAEPRLAERLQAVVERLVSGRVDAGQLAAIGLDAEAEPADAPLAKALELLLRPAPAAKPAAAPPPFTAVTLAVPPDVAAPRPERLAQQPSPRPEPAAPAAPEPKEAEPAPAARPAERPAPADPSPLARSAAGAPPAAPEPPVVEAKPVPAAAVTAVATAAAASAKTVHAAYQSPPQQINVPQVAFEMVRQFQAGNSRFQIRLDPPELGRIDVRMDMDRDGNVMARMTVERSETLDLMQRDQRALERALAQAGLDSARTSLEFSLRQQGSGREQREGGGPAFGDGTGSPAAEPDTSPAPAATHHRGLASPGGVNLFV